MSLEERLLAEMKESLKKGDKLKLLVIRLVRAAIQNKEIERGKKLSSDEVIGVLASLAKKHKESMEQYKAGGRDDLVRKEKAELAVLQEYLPQPLKKEELAKIVEEVIVELKVEDKSGLGKVMSLIIPRVRGRAEGRLIKDMVLKRLGTGKEGTEAQRHKGTEAQRHRGTEAQRVRINKYCF